MGGREIRVWISKYALSKGLYQAEAIQSSTFPNLVNVNRWTTFHNDEWHTTREGALARAEKMRQAKIASLKKQLERLEKLRFSE